MYWKIYPDIFAQYEINSFIYPSKIRRLLMYGRDNILWWPSIYCTGKETGTGWCHFQRILYCIVQQTSNKDKHRIVAAGATCLYYHFYFPLLDIGLSNTFPSMWTSAFWYSMPQKILKRVMKKMRSFHVQSLFSSAFYILFILFNVSVLSID